MIIERLQDKTVGIAGCGGLGSNCAAALARAGVGKLVLVDFDTVSESNLNRQYFFRDQIGQKKVEALAGNIRRIRPLIQLERHDVTLVPDLVAGFFGHCDIIVEAFDQAAAKQMLIEAVLAALPGIPLVCGIGLAGWGLGEAIHIRRDGNLIFCGDFRNEVSDSLPPLAPRVGIVASMQANIVLELLLGPCPGLI